MSDMVGKFIVDEEGSILEVMKADSDYVWCHEYDTKGSAQVMLAIHELVHPHAVFFDSVIDAQKYVEDNFETEGDND